jgi:hypothetical protein
VSSGVLLLILAAIAAAGLIAYLSYQAEQKRRQILQSFALSNGWAYAARDDSWTERFAGSPFGEGDHRSAKNVLTGAHAGRQMAAFDYSFQTHSTDSKGHTTTTTHRYAVCAVRLPAPLPGLELSPETVLTRFAGALGFDDVELESEDFNRHYRVRARDPKFAYDVLNPRTMQALLARPALHLRLFGADALCWESGRLAPAALLERLSALDVLIDGIPSFVWADHTDNSTT